MLVARGRSHLYEGYGPRPVVALARIAAAAGVRGAVLVNAGGCLRSWKIGEVMTITDHLNLTGSSPFDGRSSPTFAVRGTTSSLTSCAVSHRGQASMPLCAGRSIRPWRRRECWSPPVPTVSACPPSWKPSPCTSSGARGRHERRLRPVLRQAPTDPDEVVRLAAGAHTTIAAGTEAVLAAMS